MLGILAAVLLAASPADTVYTADGGRLVGTVIEETPQAVSIQLPDGTTRRLERRDVARIEYADGSVSTPNRAPPPPPAATKPAPAPTAAPPAPPPYQPYNPPPYAPPPPSYRAPPPSYRPPPPPASGPATAAMEPILPVYATLGLGGMAFGGEAESGVNMDRVFGSQLNVNLEGGLRLTPNLALGVYVDIGVGDPSSEVRQACEAQAGLDCTASTGRVGVLLRHTFTPRAPSTPWLAIGTGGEFGSVNLNDHSGSGSSNEFFSYTGWEMLRVMGGIDLRTNPVLGFGLYGGLSFGKYTHVEDPFGRLALDNQGVHTMAEAGIRLVLFP